MTRGSWMALSALLVAGFPSAAHAARCEPAVPRVVMAPADSTWSALYGAGLTFPDFLAAAKARREGWLRLADSAEVSEALLARAKAVGGTWRLLVVAIDACGDSMNSVPYLARLAASVPGMELRIVLPKDGRAVQEAHKSIDGRNATPTIVLLDAEGRDRGCIVELPRQLRMWAHSVRRTVSSDRLHAGIRQFYAANRGEAIVTEAVEMLEAARAGRVLCDRGS